MYYGDVVPRLTLIIFTYFSVLHKEIFLPLSARDFPSLPLQCDHRVYNFAISRIDRAKYRVDNAITTPSVDSKQRDGDRRS